MRIAVISDQHIDRAAEPESWEYAKAAYRAAADAKVDHVVLAGDIFDCATAMQSDQDRVRKHLKKLGLWHRDRLSIVMGNHDIFHTPHHGSLPAKLAEFANQAWPGVVAANVQAFVDWAGDVVNDEDWASDDLWAPYTKQLGHVRLMVASTVADDVQFGGNGFWWDEIDTPLRDLGVAVGERRVLAVHHAPFKDKLQTITDFLAGEFSYGYDKGNFKALRSFADDQKVAAILCGHLHSYEGDDAEWDLGKQCRVYLQGRAGGMYATACINVLTVPRRGPLRWKDIEL